MLLADLLISLWLRGLLPRAVRLGRAAPAALMLALVLAGAPAADAQQPPKVAASPAQGAPGDPAQPQARPSPAPLSEEQALKGALDTRLAYILTGDKEIDDLSKAGLEGLSEIL